MNKQAQHLGKLSWNSLDENGKKERLRKLKEGNKKYWENRKKNAKISIENNIENKNTIL